MEKTKKNKIQKMVTEFFRSNQINLSDIKAEKLDVIQNIYDTMLSYSNDKTKKKPVFNNIMNIISNEKILIIAYNNIKSNSGAGTKSMNEITADKMSINKIKKISLELKQNKFKFNLIRQVYVPKPGKGIMKWTKKKLIEFGRPLGIPDFEDKIVQEAIRMVLSAIYEPLFDKTNSYGFRPSYSSLNAMIQISEQAQGMDYILEGDISSAFNTMVHKILIKSLSQYIFDQKFLTLVLKCCEAGIFDSIKNSKEFPTIGTPQGAIVSPILWNIYMYNFDTFIANDIMKLIDILNKKQLIKKANPNDKRTMDLYRYPTVDPTKSNENKTVTTKLLKVKKQILEISGRNPFSRLPIQKQKILIPIIKEKSRLEKILYNSPSMNLARIKIRILYIRYADDFILITNANPMILKYIKNKISSYLKYYLELNLSEKKTLITNMKKETAHFLGFSLFRFKSQKLTYVQPHIKKRTTGSEISIGIDYRRVLKKLIEKGYLTKQLKIKSISELTKRENVEILMRFNEIIIGHAIYYLPVISRTNYFNRLLYIFEYSFYKTLCHKNKTTIRKLRTQHNDKVTFIRPNLINPENSKYHTIINFKNFDELVGKIIQRIRDNLYSKTEQRLIIKNIMIEYRKGYWRTNASMLSACMYCGSWDDIEYHHINKLSPYKKKYKYSFDFNIRAINSKAIPLCTECHFGVHHGKFSNTEIIDLYDKRLATYQNYIKIKKQEQYKNE